MKRIYEHYTGLTQIGLFLLVFFGSLFHGMVELQLKVQFFSGSMDWTFNLYIDIEKKYQTTPYVCHLGSYPKKKHTWPKQHMCDVLFEPVLPAVHPSAIICCCFRTFVDM